MNGKLKMIQKAIRKLSHIATASWNAEKEERELVRARAGTRSRMRAKTRTRARVRARTGESKRKSGRKKEKSRKIHGQFSGSLYPASFILDDSHVSFV